MDSSVQDFEVESQEIRNNENFMNFSHNKKIIIGALTSILAVFTIIMLYYYLTNSGLESTKTRPQNQIQNQNQNQNPDFLSKSQIFFLGYNENQELEIFAVDPNGKNIQTLTSNFNNNKYESTYFNFSADSRKILFLINNGIYTRSSYGIDDFKLIFHESSMNKIDPSMKISDPSFNSKGDQIIFVGTSSTHSSIYTIDYHENMSKTKKFSSLLNFDFRNIEKIYYPTYSSDDRYIVCIIKRFEKFYFHVIYLKKEDSYNIEFELGEKCPTAPFSISRNIKKMKILYQLNNVFYSVSIHGGKHEELYASHLNALNCRAYFSPNAKFIVISESLNGYTDRIKYLYFNSDGKYVLYSPEYLKNESDEYINGSVINWTDPNSKTRLNK